MLLSHNFESFSPPPLQCKDKAIKKRDWIILSLSSSLLLFKCALCYVSGCCKNDKRKHGQKVWFILACSSGRRLWLWAHTWSQKSSLYVFWRDCGSLYLEVLMKRKWHPLMNYSCIYINNFWHNYSMENILIGAEDLQHQPSSSQWTKYFSPFFVLSMEFDVLSWLCIVLKNVSFGGWI